MYMHKLGAVLHVEKPRVAVQCSEYGVQIEMWKPPNTIKY